MRTFHFIFSDSFSAKRRTKSTPRASMQEQDRCIAFGRSAYYSAWRSDRRVRPMQPSDKLMPHLSLAWLRRLTRTMSQTAAKYGIANGREVVSSRPECQYLSHRSNVNSCPSVVCTAGICYNEKNYRWRNRTDNTVFLRAKLPLELFVFYKRIMHITMQSSPTSRVADYVFGFVCMCVCLCVIRFCKQDISKIFIWIFAKSIANTSCVYAGSD